MSVLRGQSASSDERTAVQELRAAIDQPDSAFILVFCSAEFDRDVLAQELARAFGDTPVIGCTTAGEIGPSGYIEGTLAGASFSSDDFAAATGSLRELSGFESAQARELSQRMLLELEQRSPWPVTDRTAFCIQLIDGLSRREELVTSAMQQALGTVPMVGGSAGDSGRFEHTWVLGDGAFVEDAAAYALVSTRLSFEQFKIQHFVPTESRLVVTEAEPSIRRVTEIDGWPAAEQYARHINEAVAELDAEAFAANPVVVMIDGTEFVRSVQKADSDGSITFYSAVEEGLVLRIARAGDLVVGLEESLEDLRSRLGDFEAVIAFDCVLRRQEAIDSGIGGRIGDLLRTNGAVGFNTYGEQIRGLHINQTLTGIALGRPHE